MKKNLQEGLVFAAHVATPFLVLFLGFRVFAPWLISYPSTLTVIAGAMVCFAALVFAVVYGLTFTRAAVLNMWERVNG